MIMLSCSEVRFSLADIYTTPSKTAFFGGGGVYTKGRAMWLISQC